MTQLVEPPGRAEAGKAGPLLRVENISKAFVAGPTPVHALQAADLQIDAGEFICLLGPSGSGKSTLLRIIGGLLEPDKGAVWFGGEALTEPHDEIGFVFQQTNLMPWRTVVGNVLLPLEVKQRGIGETDRAHAHQLLGMVGLLEFAHAYPKQLSGGMRQRAVLARTLIHRPQLLLLDEPFGALDALTRERLNLELLRIQMLNRTTVLMVTHSIPEAVFLADRVIVLSDRPGRVVGEIEVDLARPRAIEQMGGEQFGQLTMQVRRLIGDPS